MDIGNRLQNNAKGNMVRKEIEKYIFKRRHKDAGTRSLASFLFAAPLLIAMRRMSERP